MRLLRLVVLGAVLALVVLAAMASRSSAPPPAPGVVAGVSATPAAGAPAPTSSSPPSPTSPPANEASGTPATPATASSGSRALASTLADTVSATVQAFAAAADDDRILYAAALRARDAGAYAYAITMFRRVMVRNGALAPIASLRLAQAQVAAGDRDAAADAFAQALARADFASILRATARFDAADNAVALGRPQAALAQLTAIRSDPDADVSDRAAAAYQAAQIRYEEGDAAWIDDAIAVVTLEPWSLPARAALELLEAEGAAVPPFAAAHVRYRAFDNDAARASYEQALAGATPADAAIAWFYLGAIAERAGDPTSALGAYARSIALAPDGSLADDARYWRGRILDDRGDFAAAVAEYDRLAADFPGAPFTPDARMRAAIQLALVDGGAHGADALERFRQITLTGTRAAAADAARWQAVFREHLGLTHIPAMDPRAFDQTALPSLLTARSGSGVLGFTFRLPDSARAEVVTAPNDASTVAAWLQSTFGSTTNGSPPALTDHRYLLGRELVSVGETATARALSQQLLGELDGRPDDLYALAQSFGVLGLADLQLNAAGRLLSPLSPAQRLSAPRSVLSLAYPIAYDRELTRAATDGGLPVLLLAALVRQESAWNPLAVSSANALGLTQVTVPTGRQIAADLGVAWDADRLFDPATALTFGAYYLSAQLRTFDGDVAAAVAAYNAGPGSSARWLEDRPIAGTDGFRLAVDFSETARFISRVLENYAWYRYIYAGAPAPQLP